MKVELALEVRGFVQSVSVFSFDGISFPVETAVSQGPLLLSETPWRTDR